MPDFSSLCGTGFLGGHLARLIAEAGGTVAVLARAGADRSRLADLNIVWLEGDLTDPVSLKGRLPVVDYVIHAAGMLGRRACRKPHIIASM